MIQVEIYFKRSNGERRFIKEIECEVDEIIDESFAIIKDYIEENFPHFKIYYTRCWTNDDGEIWFDVSSHSEFFIAKRKENNNDL